MKAALAALLAVILVACGQPPPRTQLYYYYVYRLLAGPHYTLACSWTKDPQGSQVYIAWGDWNQGQHFDTFWKFADNPGLCVVR